MFGDRIMRKRRQLARSLERVAVPERPVLGRGPRYIVHPTVSVACAPSLLAIAAALRDGSRSVTEEELHALQSFIRGGDSPFFGRDVTAAMREAVRLQHAVVGATQSALENEHVASLSGQDTYPTPVLSGR